jgi:[ribosomal protein S18]-alanine N-acetyltransferase
MTRQATEHDVMAIAMIERLSFAKDAFEASFWLQEITENPFARVFVEADRTSVKGHIGIRLSGTEADIVSFAVHPDWRRQGVATALIKAVADHLRQEGARTLSLEVRKSNVAARALYERLGFMNVNVRKRYYGDEDAVVYLLEVSP